MKSAFDTRYQNSHLEGKVVAGLERISEAFRVLLWEHAKATGLSPIQIQILIFIRHHHSDICHVSGLATEFNMSRPTISDAVKVLFRKKMLEKHPSPADKRAYTMTLTDTGRQIVEQTEQFAHPIQDVLQQLNESELSGFYIVLTRLIQQLNRAGIISVQRTCFNCRYLTQSDGEHFCTLIGSKLSGKDIRLDCPEFKIAD